jgi:phosphohistidine phosphatase
MSKTLLVMRHAKSSWSNGELPDHERPLNARGRHEAEQMGQELARLGWRPDLILASTARRARSTAKRVARELNDVDITLDGRLYDSTPGACLRVLAERGTGETVLLIGHNPTLEDLVRDLALRYIGLPTATVAVVRLAIDDWAQVDGVTSGQLEAVLTPREADVTAMRLV